MPSDPTRSGGPRYTRGQRRLLTAAAGLVVAALAGGAFVLTFDMLRDLAVAGRASRRWAPVYPVMADALTALTILSLVVARDARWWTRLTRWTLLLVLAGGAAALSVQSSLRGFGALPGDPLRTGVAVAPHVMLVLAVWLWLTMVKQIRTVRPAADAPEPPDRQRGHVKVIEAPAAGSADDSGGAAWPALEAERPGPAALPGPPALAAPARPAVAHRRPGATRPDLVMPARYRDDEYDGVHEGDYGRFRANDEYEDDYTEDEERQVQYGPEHAPPNGRYAAEADRHAGYRAEDDQYDEDDPRDSGYLDEGGRHRYGPEGDNHRDGYATEEDDGLYASEEDEEYGPVSAVEAAHREQNGAEDDLDDAPRDDGLYAPQDAAYEAEGDEHDEQLADRAEDPDGGDEGQDAPSRTASEAPDGEQGDGQDGQQGEQDGGPGDHHGGKRGGRAENRSISGTEEEIGDLPILTWNRPPSGSFRSSPVPPAE
ncbi:DUF2637 domain-containing protein [Actinomadura roseirufa]|uniref:DUF2637 domain-containing protein n=1 Tax=Actinomadura roseirufa TaxID=2094049 RepID=UPI001040E848|nr:DUF2637 domain-containing protein [Actinomadura roseirufa]